MEVREDVIDKMYDVISKYIDKKTLSVQEQEIILNGLDFKNLYSSLYTRRNSLCDEETIKK